MEKKNVDQKVAKEYLQRLSGNNPSTSYLLDLYLRFLPADSLVTKPTIDLIKKHLSVPLQINSIGFQTLLQDYQNKLIRNQFLTSSWNKMKNLISASIDSTSFQADDQLIHDIIDLQEKIYPTPLVEIYQLYYQAKYYATQKDEARFIDAFEKYVKLLNKPGDFDKILAYDHQEYEQALKLESEAAYPAQLSDKMLKDLRIYHNGYIRSTQDQLIELIQYYKVWFPEAFEIADKESIDQTLIFALKLNKNNLVSVNEFRNKYAQNFIDSYKKL